MAAPAAGGFATHLRAALGESPSLAEYAREDTDLGPIRDDPRFAEIVTVS